MSPKNQDASLLWQVSNVSKGIRSESSTCFVSSHEIQPARPEALDREQHVISLFHTKKHVGIR